MKRHLLALLVLGMFAAALVGCHGESDNQKPSSGTSISLAR